MPQKFENIGFTLKMHQMFSFHSTPKEFRKATISGMFSNSSGLEHFEKLHFCDCEL